MAASRSAIEARFSAAAAGISHAKREVILETGERISYDRLVIATGARPDNGALGEVDQPHVFRLNTYADGVRLM